METKGPTSFTWNPNHDFSQSITNWSIGYEDDLIAEMQYWSVRTLITTAYEYCILNHL
jgi:hypothetical protein